MTDNAGRRGPDAEFFYRFFRCMGFDDLDLDSFWVRTDGEYAPVTIFANCNDLFYWACSDAEPVTPENIGELERAVADIKPFRDAWSASYRENPATEVPYVASHIAVLLFCARVRKMRPQGAFYDSFPPGVDKLFDEAGPDRKNDISDTGRRMWKPAKPFGSLASDNATIDPPWKCAACRIRELENAHGGQK